MTLASSSGVSRIPEWCLLASNIFLRSCESTTAREHCCSGPNKRSPCAARCHRYMSRSSDRACCRSTAGRSEG